MVLLPHLTAKERLEGECVRFGNRLCECLHEEVVDVMVQSLLLFALVYGIIAAVPPFHFISPGRQKGGRLARLLRLRCSRAVEVRMEAMPRDGGEPSSRGFCCTFVKSVS